MQISHVPESLSYMRSPEANGLLVQHQLTFNPLQMLSIFNPEQQVCIINRKPQVTIVDYLQNVALRMAPGFRSTVSMRQPIMQQLQTLSMPAYAGRNDLIQDIESLVTIFSELMNCDHVGIRLEVLQKAMCPQFHIDRIGIRLLCTYIGPGTEWLEETHADQHYLKSPGLSTDPQQNVILDNCVIRQANPFDLILLKGCQWQDKTKGGAMHRSPEITEEQIRVVLALDAITD